MGARLKKQWRDRKFAEPLVKIPREKSATYSVDLADYIVLRIARGETMNAICREEGMPSVMGFLKWLMADRDGLQEKYRLARVVQSDVWADETKDISDTPELGVKTIEEVDAQGNVTIKRITGDMPEHRRLRIVARQWLLARLDPERFADRSKTELTGANGKALIPDGIFTPEQRVAALTTLFNAVRARITRPDSDEAGEMGAATGSADDGVLIEG